MGSNTNDYKEEQYDNVQEDDYIVKPDVEKGRFSIRASRRASIIYPSTIYQSRRNSIDDPIQH